MKRYLYGSVVAAAIAAVAVPVTGVASTNSGARGLVAAKIVYHSRISDTYKIGKKTYAKFPNNEILVATSPKATPSRLAKHPASDSNPTWSPSGTSVAFESNRNGDWQSERDSDIFVVKANGSKVTELTFSNAYDGDPAWSRTNKIAFESERTGNADIWVINANGSGETQLTTSAAFDGDPSWSPNGQKIAFTSQRDGGDREIYVMNADGSNQTRLTTSPGFDENPTWSPDGQHIAFDTNRDGNLEIYVMNADGSEQTRVTNHPAIDALPSFLPNGDLVFVSERIGKGQRRLYQMHADGTSPAMISRGAYDMSPDANRW